MRFHWSRAMIYTYGITSLVFKMSKIFENSTEFIQIEWINAIKSININKYLREMCKNHSQKLATRQISIQSFNCDFKFNPVFENK
jgi:hypothetical protein